MPQTERERHVGLPGRRREHVNVTSSLLLVTKRAHPIITVPRRRYLLPIYVAAAAEPGKTPTA